MTASSGSHGPCGLSVMLQVREIREMCPDLTVEEAQCALKQCHDRCCCRPSLMMLQDTTPAMLLNIDLVSMKHLVCTQQPAWLPMYQGGRRSSAADQRRRLSAEGQAALRHAAARARRSPCDTAAAPQGVARRVTRVRGACPGARPSQRAPRRADCGQAGRRRLCGHLQRWTACRACMGWAHFVTCMVAAGSPHIILCDSAGC